MQCITKIYDPGNSAIVCLIDQHIVVVGVGMNDLRTAAFELCCNAAIEPIKKISDDLPPNRVINKLQSSTGTTRLGEVPIKITNGACMGKALQG